MHMQVVVSQVHHMGRVTKPEILKALPLIEVKVLERPPFMNRSPKISLTLRRYRWDIPSNNLAQPCD